MSSNDGNEHERTERTAPEDTPAETDHEEAQTQSSAGDAETANDHVAGALSFDDMGLHPDVLKAVHALGFDDAMEVQKVTYPEILAGKDLLVQSRTGSGKTAAFGIPFAQGLVDADVERVQALVLCPTRELAKQVADEVAALGRFRGLRILPVYGGAPLGPQIKALKQGVHVVAGTPGRVLDHLKRKTLKLDDLTVLVLDECDEMLSMGFQEEIQGILEFVPEKRQTLLFSATIGGDVERLSAKYMQDPERISLSDDFVGVLEVDHYYYLSTSPARHMELARILEIEQPESAIVFCNTREETNVVSRFLKKRNYRAEAISSDLSQKERDRVMERMRRGKIQLLVATDVAARGIDIQDLSHVFNYGFPDSAQVYVHRTGRTGRAGKKGMAVSLITPQDLGNFYYMKLAVGIEPEEKRLPGEKELLTRREGERYAALADAFDAEAQPEYASLARRVWYSPVGEKIFSNLLQHYFEGRFRRAQRPAERDRGRGGRDRRGRDERPHPKDGEDGREKRGRRVRESGQERGGRTTKLYVNVGRKDGLKVASLKSLLADLSSVEENDLGRIRMRETHSFIKLDREPANRLMAQANGKMFNEKTLVVEPARK
jgi:ATP-dependent RNA helicase DeaD